MGFEELPKDLKNIVSAFAYDCGWEIVEKDLEMCKVVNGMELSGVFTRHVMWSAKYKEFIPSPLLAFEPIQNYTGFWGDYIDWHAVQELMWRLDFRRKFVKLMRSREEWRRLFRNDWRTILLFDSFYRFLLYTRVPCFKPLWKLCGFNCLKSFRSPFQSARWWLDDVGDTIH
jgi:hypothetical protein